jgi:hypothetical protein
LTPNRAIPSVYSQNKASQKAAYSTEWPGGEVFDGKRPEMAVFGDSMIFGNV